MGMFQDLFKLTREAQELKRNTPTPSMGEMVGQMREAVEDINAQQADAGRLLAEGVPGTAIIREMGTPERGAAWFNLMLDLEVHPRTREPYRVANEYLVPAAAHLEQGVELPVMSTLTTRRRSRSTGTTPPRARRWERSGRSEQRARGRRRSPDS